MIEKMMFGLQLAAIGMGIVFGVLALISLFVSAMRKLDNRWQERERAQAMPAPRNEQNVDDVTLALIVAAAATMVVGRSRIRSIRRLSTGETRGVAWSVQGRAVLHGAHLPPKTGARL